MSEKQSLTKLKAKLEKITAREQKLNEEAESLRKVIQEEDDSFNESRKRHLKFGVSKILEETGWTKVEYIDALGGQVKEQLVRKITGGTKREYVNLIPLNQGGDLASGNHIRLTPRLSEQDRASLNASGLIPLLKHTIAMTRDDSNKARAEARLKAEEAKIQYKVT